ncbi:hypothetical protein, partial [Xanthomonas perforans]|uniref:hypothetical protein n=1 Tax=Xanthomonas perforans TaxID=442694 RepID=UPI003CE58698
GLHGAIHAGRLVDLALAAPAAATAIQSRQQIIGDDVDHLRTAALHGRTQPWPSRLAPGASSITSGRKIQVHFDRQGFPTEIVDDIERAKTPTVP